MDVSSRKELIEKFFRKAKITVTIDESDVVEISHRKGEIIIDIKNPFLLMGLGIDLDMLKKKKDSQNSVIRKFIKELGFKIKVRYKFLEFDV